MATKNSIDSNIPIEVSKGGTAAVTLLDHGVLIGSGTSAVTAITVGATGELLVGAAGADAEFGSSANADFTFGGANSGATRTLKVDNTSNTASSASNVSIVVGGGSAADPQTSYIVIGETTFSVGLDNNDSDKFKIAASASLGTTDVFVSTVDGEITMPLQPAFNAQGQTQTNVTGDGTTYTMVFDNAEFFDQNNDFDGTSTFTAPVTGKYQLNTNVYGRDFLSSHTSAYLQIVTSNRTYSEAYINPYAARNTGNDCALSMSVLADMDASDTATITFTTSGGTKVIGVSGSSDIFNGFLAC